MIRAGLTRALELFVAAAAASAVVALVVGALVGAAVGRSVAVGWYCGGAFVLLIGFVTATRGPTRAEDTGGWSPISMRGRGIRWATRAEQEESLSVSVLLVLLGLGLILLGAAVDTRHRLF